MTQFPDHPLWDFAIATYTQDGVAEICLDLQEAYGAEALRQVRKRMKQGLDGVAADDLQMSLRAQLQKLEIDMEHAEQLRLGAVLDTLNTTDEAGGTELAVANLAGYLGALGAPSSPETAAALRQIAVAGAAVESR